MRNNLNVIKPGQSLLFVIQLLIAFLRYNSELNNKEYDLIVSDRSLVFSN